MKECKHYKKLTSISAVVNASFVGSELNKDPEKAT